MSTTENTYADDVTMTLQPSRQGHYVPKPDKGEHWNLNQFCDFWTKFDFLESKPRKSIDDQLQLTNTTSDGEEQEEKENQPGQSSP